MSQNGPDQLDGELRRAFAWLASTGNFMIVARDGEVHLYRGSSRTSARWDGTADGVHPALLTVVSEAQKKAQESS